MAFVGKESRSHKRIRQAFSVEGRCVEGLNDIHPFHGRTRDISLRGLCVKLGDTNGFKVGQNIEISIKLLPNEPHIEAFGNVCWLNTSHNPEWPVKMGLELTGMGAVRQYERWIEMLSLLV